MTIDHAHTGIDLGSLLKSARANTDALFSILRDDSLYERPIPHRHRIIFYLGHLEAFDWNLICTGPLGERPFNADYDQLFAFGIDPESSDLPTDTPADWPMLEQVQDYNARVRKTIDDNLARVPEQILHVAIEHRLMHSETLAYILHELPYERKLAPKEAPEFETSALSPEMVEIPAGAAVMGRTAALGFGWDNEFERHEVSVPSFSVGKHKVSNGEYLALVEDGGGVPHRWRRGDDGWYYRGMFREMPLPRAWPVYVTQEQANNYAEWSGKRLITEAEYQRAAYGAGGGEDSRPDPKRDNFDFQQWDPIPVNDSEENSFGVRQMVGNGWEWTSTPFEPFPGFEPFPFYPGYSANFFDGKHYVMKGASARTAAKLTRPSFRNWFRSSYPYMYAGFRVAEK